MSLYLIDFVWNYCSVCLQWDENAMCDELKNENKHQAYGSMSNPIDSLIQDKQNADHPAKIQDNAVSLVVPNALSDDNAPSPSSGSRYPKQDPMHNQPPSYPGGGTYIQPYSANQSKGLVVFLLHMQYAFYLVVAQCLLLALSKK